MHFIFKTSTYINESTPPEKNRKFDFLDGKNCNFSAMNIFLIVVFITSFPLAK